MRSDTQRYAGKVTAVGNSKGIRLDAGFFKAHPEFSGEVQATVLGEGQVLVSAKTKARRPAKRTEPQDPVMVSFLAFLEQQMGKHPEMIKPLDPALLQEIAALVKGVVAE